MDRSDAEDFIDVTRKDLALSRNDRRFPRKGTCMEIYSRRVNGDEELDYVLRRYFPWCQMWAKELKELFREYITRKQRQNTLLVTMHAIINYQREYFLMGEETKLRPMILKDIADMTGLDVSTVSRVANSKYIQTNFGIFPLKYFFSEGMQTDSGEEVSTREIKKILQDCVDAEDKRHPLTDDRLAEILNDKGYQIARRTIAKYREQLNIPVARMRKEF